MIKALPSQLSSIAAFCKAAELQSFTAAALTLGLTPAAVSRSIGRLELRLGLKLFRRSTRNVQLSEEGRIYYEQCHAALTQIEDAERVLTGEQSEPKGLLRISLPSTYAHYRLLPSLPQFHKKHPNIRLDINVSNRNIDFIEEGYDLAIRLGEPPDSRLIAKKLEDAPLGLYANPSYLAEFGSPADYEALQDHKRYTLLPFLLPSTGKVLPWLLNVSGSAVAFTPSSRFLVSEDPLASVSLARAGLGIVQTMRWIGQAHHSELREILPDLSGRSRPFYVLYPESKKAIVRVRVMVAFLVGLLDQGKSTESTA